MNKNGWIDVKEKLPSDDELVLVRIKLKTKNKEVFRFAMYYNKNKGWYDYNNDDEKIQYSKIVVTHWQPFPFLPDTEI